MGNDVSASVYTYQEANRNEIYIIRSKTNISARLIFKNPNKFSLLFAASSRVNPRLKSYRRKNVAR